MTVFRRLLASLRWEQAVPAPSPIKPRARPPAPPRPVPLLPVRAALLAASPNAPAHVIAGLERIDLDDEGVTNRKRLAALVGQCAVESAGFTRSVENLSYSAGRLVQVWPSRFSQSNAAAYARAPQRLANYVYASRLGNGPESSGDGWRYRGRGWLQLTGRANYRAAGTELGIDLESNPDFAADPDVAWRVACWFLRTRKRAGMTGWEWADEREWGQVSRLVNGGTHGLADRIRRTESAMLATAETMAA